MTRSRRFLSIACLAAVATLWACAEPPQAELDATRAALQAAEEAQASMYATAEIDAAREAMTAVDTEMAEQAGKLAMLRSYDRTRELAVEAQTKAETARTAAVAAKEEARAAAQAAADGVAAQLASAAQMVGELATCGKQPKGFAADLAAIEGSLGALQGQVEPIQSALAGEDFAGATAQAESLGGQTQVLIDDLTSAREKLGCAPVAATPSV
jgi:hypothetical protein